jgi:hypothetical protein
MCPVGCAGWTVCLYSSAIILVDYPLKIQWEIVTVPISDCVFYISHFIDTFLYMIALEGHFEITL